jgi:hypothetical protein
MALVPCLLCGKRTTHNTADPVRARREGKVWTVGYRCAACRRAGREITLEELNSLSRYSGRQWEEVEILARPSREGK